MAAAWIKTVEAADIKDEALYFVAKRDEMSTYYFQARDKHNKACFSVKPGLAVQFVGSDKLRSELVRLPNLHAIEVPPDAHKLWRRRR